MVGRFIGALPIHLTCIIYAGTRQKFPPYGRLIRLLVHPLIHSLCAYKINILYTFYYQNAFNMYKSVNFLPHQFISFLYSKTKL